MYYYFKEMAQHILTYLIHAERDLNLTTIDDYAAMTIGLTTSLNLSSFGHIQNRVRGPC